MTAAETVEQLRAMGSDSYKRIMMRHGILEPIFGVSVEELKKIQKRVKKDYQLANDLYDTGIYDAMYLAGLIADESKMTKADLKRWLAKTPYTALCGSALAWVAAESRHGWELGLEWIESPKELVATAGWETLGSLVAVKEDAELDLPALKKLLARVEKTIHEQLNKVRYSMNGFVIAVGTYVKPLSDAAMKTAEKIGVVSCDVGDTSCKVPLATAYIEKAMKKGTIGKKRKSARC